MKLMVPWWKFNLASQENDTNLCMYKTEALFPKKKGRVEITKLCASAAMLMTEWSPEEDRQYNIVFFIDEFTG
jgi:hypothetical protein